MPSSALEQYTLNYGQRLQSLLVPQTNAVIDTSSVLGRQPAQSSTPERPQRQAPQQQQRELTPDQLLMMNEERTSLLEPNPEEEAPPLPGARPPDLSTLPGADGRTPPFAPPGLGGNAAPPGPGTETSALEKPKGTSARSLYEGMSDKEQQKQASDLEDTLKRAGTNIDEAYGELVKQMGTRPDENLTKKEKAMLLMEFGLNLMAQSARRRHGGDLVGAMGDAGLNSFDSAQRAKGAKARDWDARRSALDTARVRAKEDLGEFAAREEIKADATLPSQHTTTAPKLDRFVGADGYYYLMTDGGTPERMKDADGNPIKAPEKETTPGANQTSDYERRYNYYMDIYGKDSTGKPLVGEALARVRRKALEYAGDVNKATLSDAEIRMQASKSVDEYMRINEDAYRDYTPAQREAERKRLLKDRIAELRQGSTSALADDAENPPPAPPPTTGVPSFLQPASPFLDQPKAPPVSALVAGKARKITGFEGYWTLDENGRPKRVR